MQKLQQVDCCFVNWCAERCLNKIVNEYNVFLYKRRKSRIIESEWRSSYHEVVFRSVLVGCDGFNCHIEWIHFIAELANKSKRKNNYKMILNSYFLGRLLWWMFVNPLWWHWIHDSRLVAAYLQSSEWNIFVILSVVPSNSFRTQHPTSFRSFQWPIFQNNSTRTDLLYQLTMS